MGAPRLPIASLFSGFPQCKHNIAQRLVDGFLRRNLANLLFPNETLQSWAQLCCGHANGKQIPPAAVFLRSNAAFECPGVHNLRYIMANLCEVRAPLVV